MKPQDRPPTPVFLVTQFLGVGGLERMILNLATELKRRGRYAPTVVAYDVAPGQPTLHSSFAEAGIPVVDLDKPRGFSLRVAFRLRALAREAGRASGRRPLLHTHDLGPLIYGVIARILGGARLAHTEHSFVHLARKKRHAFYEKLFARLANRLCVVSPDLVREYESMGLDPRNILLVDNGVRFAETPPTPEARSTLRRSLLAAHTLDNHHLDRAWIVCLARLHPGKGQDHLIRAWGELPAELHARATLFLVGPETSPGERLRLEELRLALSHEARHSIELTGNSNRPQDWLAAADGYASASDYEGQPLGPLEAAGQGLPVFLSDIPGHHLLGESATYAERGEALGPGLATWLARVLFAPVDLAERYRHALEIRARFGTGRMAERYEAVYDEVLK